MKFPMLIISFILTLVLFGSSPRIVLAAGNNSWWEIQSVDTMKYSRDAAGQGLNDPAFVRIIQEHVTEIASAGATHVAVATPYDPEFLPYLKLWVLAARSHGLNVWFRGNWSGWEGWFGYPPMTRQSHLDKTKAFILDNPGLFADGDIFTPCPECENGGPGDPRNTGDVAGFRQFLISEYQMTKAAFASIRKNVRSNFASMNADVARLIMDPATTAGLDGVVTIDHYVSTPDDYARDIENLARSSGGRIVVGEFGSPVPDVTGDQTENQQAEWLNGVLQVLASHRPEILGLNYWVGVGGSTQLWDTSGQARPAAGVLKSFYSPSRDIKLRVKNDLGRPVPGLTAVWLGRSYLIDKTGNVTLPYLNLDVNTRGILVTDPKGVYKPVSVMAKPAVGVISATISPKHPDIFYRIRAFFVHLFG